MPSLYHNLYALYHIKRDDYMCYITIDVSYTMIIGVAKMLEIKGFSALL